MWLGMWYGLEWIGGKMTRVSLVNLVQKGVHGLGMFNGHFLCLWDQTAAVDVCTSWSSWNNFVHHSLRCPPPPLLKRSPENWAAVGAFSQAKYSAPIQCRSFWTPGFLLT